MMYPYMNNQYMNSMQSPYVTPQRQEIIRVHGRNGADAFNLPPNSSALLLDEQEPIVYLKTSDGAGYATITSYSIVPYKPETTTDLKALEERISKIEERLNESNTSSPNRTKQSNKNNANSESD